MFNDLDRIMILQEEIALLKSRLEPHDTGHLHTTIYVLTERVVELREEIDARLYSKRS
jgi:uncharacterized small protein (DUF1192 family)